jgi:hypothetical protein
LSTVEQAQQHFTGHQEFFFIFILSADSYKFNFHLRSQIARLIKAELSVSEHQPTMNLEKKVLHQQMLARFLGALVFSPSWHEFENWGAYSTVADLTPPDGLLQLESDADVSLSLNRIVRDAWKEGYLTEVIPWVTELLKMAIWDASIHSRSENFRNLLSLLRDVQAELSNRVYKQCRNEKVPPCQQFVLWCLEAFFGEAVGLAKVASLQTIDSQLSESKKESLSSCVEGDGLTVDESPLTPSSSLLFASNPHMEDLFGLAATLSRTDHLKSARSPGISRKLRPSMVSRDVALVTCNGLRNGTLDMPAVGSGDVATTTMTKPGNGSLETKLVDTFFHQHRELKEICEFSVHQILKKMATLIPEKVVKQALEERPILGSEGINTATASAVVASALHFLRSSLEEGVHQALVLLEPSNTHPKVHEMAVALAVTRGYEVGAPHVTSLVTNDLTPLQKSLFSDKMVKDETLESPSILESPKQHNGHAAVLMSKMTGAVDDLISSIERNLSEGSIESVRKSIQSLDDLLDSWLASVDSKPPPETILREYFVSVAKLDQCSIEFINSCRTTQSADIVKTSTNQNWLVLTSFLRVASKLSCPPRRGLNSVVKYLRNPASLYAVLQFGLANGTPMSLAELLMDMVAGHLISAEQLEEALIRNLENSEEILALSKACAGLFETGAFTAFRMPKLTNQLKQ